MQQHFSTEGARNHNSCSSYIATRRKLDSISDVYTALIGSPAAIPLNAAGREAEAAAARSAARSAVCLEVLSEQMQCSADSN